MILCYSSSRNLYTDMELLLVKTIRDSPDSESQSQKILGHHEFWPLSLPQDTEAKVMVILISDFLHACSVTKSCLTLCNPLDCSPPGSSVHGISQARILEWVAISFSKGSSPPRDQTRVSCIGRWILHHQATREAHGTMYLSKFVKSVTITISTDVTPCQYLCPLIA